MDQHDNDDLFAEDIDLDDFDPASLTSLFADRNPAQRPGRRPLPSDEGLFDIADDDDDLGFDLDDGAGPLAAARPESDIKRPRPSFGSLADEDAPDPETTPGVFEPLESEDAIQPAARPRPQRPDLANAPVVQPADGFDVADEPAAADEHAEAKPKRTGLRAKIAQAKAHQRGDTAAAAATPDEQADPFAALDTSPDERYAAPDLAPNQSAAAPPAQPEPAEPRRRRRSAPSAARVATDTEHSQPEDDGTDPYAHLDTSPEGRLDVAGEDPASEARTPSRGMPKGLRGLKAKIAAARAYERGEDSAPETADAAAGGSPEPGTSQRPVKPAATGAAFEDITSAYGTQEGLVDLDEPEQAATKKPGLLKVLKDKIAEAKAAERADKPAPSSGSGAGQPPVDPPDAPALSFGDDEGDDADADEGATSAGFIAGLKAKIAAGRAYDNSEDEQLTPQQTLGFAGLDISKPTRRQRLRDRLSANKTAATTAGGPQVSSRFEALLAPVSPAEIDQLQRAVRTEEPLFNKIEKAKERGRFRQRISTLLALCTFVLWLWAAGPEHLINDVLPNAPHPDWVPDTVDEDIVGAGLFGLGFLLPFASISVLADGFVSFWRGIADRRIDDSVLAAVALACAGGVLYSVQTGYPIVGAAIFAAWLFVRAIVRLVQRRGDR